MEGFLSDAITSKNKPDACTYTHFAGSEVYPVGDGGTSAACPVAAGVVAAIRSVHTTSDITPAQLRNIIRKTARDKGNKGFDYKYGYGLINPMGIVKAITAKNYFEKLELLDGFGSSRSQNQIHIRNTLEQPVSFICYHIVPPLMALQDHSAVEQFLQMEKQVAAAKSREF